MTASSRMTHIFFYNKRCWWAKINSWVIFGASLSIPKKANCSNPPPKALKIPKISWAFSHLKRNRYSFLSWIWKKHFEGNDFYFFLWVLFLHIVTRMIAAFPTHLLSFVNWSPKYWTIRIKKDARSGTGFREKTGSYKRTPLAYTQICIP